MANDSSTGVAPKTREVLTDVVAACDYWKTANDDELADAAKHADQRRSDWASLGARAREALAELDSL